MTADAALFRSAADLGREVIWLHTFGERFNAGKPAGEPRLPEGEQPRHSAAHPIPTTPEGLLVKLEPEQAQMLLRIEDGPLISI